MVSALPEERDLATPVPFAPSFGGGPGGVERPEAAGLLVPAGEPWAGPPAEEVVAVPTTPPAAQPGLVPVPVPNLNRLTELTEPARPDATRLSSANVAARLDPDSTPSPESEADGGQSVPVVRPSHGNEDTSDWDHGAAFLFPLYVADPGAKVRAAEPEVAPEAVPTYQRRRPSGPALVPDRPVVMCSAEEAPPPELVDEEVDEEEAERVLGDLLNQDSSAWRTDGAAAAGVLE
jgi:hypothetical protein